MIYPDSGCPDLDVSLHSVYVGHKSPYNTNLQAFTVPNTTTTETSVAATTWQDNKDSPSDAQFVACSLSDGSTKCYEPYAPNTTCTGDVNVESMHFHYYYLSNNQKSIDAANAYIAATTSQFGLDIDVCADNDGHEQPHNLTCWLSGPGVAPLKF